MNERQHEPLRRRVLRAALSLIVAIFIYICVAPAARADTGAQTGRWIPAGRYRCTAYCNCRRCCGKWAGGPTKSGAMPEEGVTIATDWDVIPKGTRVLIDGRIYTAQDTGSGIYGQRIDVYIADHDRANDYGIQYHDIYIWQE